MNIWRIFAEDAFIQVVSKFKCQCFSTHIFTCLCASVKVVVSRLSCVDFHENWGTLVTAQLPPGTILHFQSHLHITAPHQMLMQKLIYSAKHVDTNITECMSNSLWDSGAREEKKKKKEEEEDESRSFRKCGSRYLYNTSLILSYLPWC